MRFALLILVALVPLVHGCAPLVVGGAAAGGIMAATDRRTVGAITEDESIELKAGSRIRERYPNAHVNVTSYNRAVLLTGEVPDAQAKAEIERIARAVENVRSVYNETIVAGVTSYAARSNDALITSKVKGRFLDAARFNPLHVKVVTENGIVYLMGIVSRQEATDATEIARTTSGVQKVVRVFEYTN